MQTLSQSIVQYLEMCEYERNLSADTLKAYRIDLRQFSEFMKGEWADRDMLNRYIKHLNVCFSPRSVKRKLASVRAFYHELEYNGILEENPFHKLHIRIQSPKQLPRTIPGHLVHDLLHEAMWAVAEKDVDVLLVANLSRLGRDTYKNEALLRWTRECGVSIVCADGTVPQTFSEILNSLVHPHRISCAQNSELTITDT